MEETLKTRIQQALAGLGIETATEAILLEYPADMAHGDYSTNIAMVLAKKIGKNPKELAGEIVNAINLTPALSWLGEGGIQIAGPGFINFYMKRSFFADQLASATKENWGTTGSFSGKKILVEHSSPNLFKPFHIGHLMNNTIGESIVRLARASGATVTTMSFPSDISLGVAKAIFILVEKGTTVDEATPVSLLGDAYVEGVKRYDEDETVHARVKEIADNLYAGIDTPELQLFTLCKKINMEYFVGVTTKLGSHFDSYVYESEAGVTGKELVVSNTPAVFTESEGAVVYIPADDAKLHTAVFLNSQGNPTYEAKDLGLLSIKFEREHPDTSIFITDGQQVSHFAVVLDAARHITPEWAEKSLHRYHGRMSFKGQKMSSRLGGVPLVEDIVGAVVEEVKEKNPDVDIATAQTIALAAIKYTILKSQAGKNINFDPDTSLSFEGDSGPYLQYTAVRAGSLIKKAADAGIAPAVTGREVAGAEILEKYITRFPGVVELSQSEWTPHYLVTYLTELAQAFNSWYGQGKIIDEDVDATSARLLVVDAVRNTLTRGLWMLGIEVPERM